MSVLLIIVGCLVLADRLATISRVGKTLVTTPNVWDGHQYVYKYQCRDHLPAESAVYQAVPA